MGPLIDIAYVIPATVAIGYFVGTWLENNREGDYLVNSILIAAACGLILSIVKIKRYVDHMNNSQKKTKSNPQSDICSTESEALIKDPT
ncbi:MAG: hypothetical protein O3C63_02985 [Cyanobacteria bacterium]|nr:hypothetical protein [Cyanobacteriota bacterium]MDA1020031.1 hypothetical protein [Cyanobacteriota bacterium]